MEWNDYIEEVRESAKDFMRDNYKHAAYYEDVHDAMVDSDEVTGGESGMFVQSEEEAKDNIQGILDDDEVLQKFIAIGYDDFPDDAVMVDVIARTIALDELYDELSEWFINS